MNIKVEEQEQGHDKWWEPGEQKIKLKWKEQNKKTCKGKKKGSVTK